MGTRRVPIVDRALADRLRHLVVLREIAERPASVTEFGLGQPVAFILVGDRRIQVGVPNFDGTGRYVRLSGTRRVLLVLDAPIVEGLTLAGVPAEEAGT